MPSSTAYFSLFSAAFLAATIIPAQSEVALSALILESRQNVVVLVLVAAIGNVLGAAVNWYLGRWIDRFSGQRWFPIKPEQLTRATHWYARYGRWSLLLSWAPFIGDPITVTAGVLREPLMSFLLIVGFAKTMRYIVVATITMSLI